MTHTGDGEKLLHKKTTPIKPFSYLKHQAPRKDLGAIQSFPIKLKKIQESLSAVNQQIPYFPPVSWSFSVVSGLRKKRFSREETAILLW